MWTILKKTAKYVANFGMIALTTICFSSAIAQNKTSESKLLDLRTISFGFRGLSVAKVTFLTVYELEKDSKQGRVNVTADIAKGWHTGHLFASPNHQLPWPISLDNSAKTVEHS